eukprot:gene11027-3733_t
MGSNLTKDEVDHVSKIPDQSKEEIKKYVIIFGLSDSGRMTLFN